MDILDNSITTRLFHFMCHEYIKNCVKNLFEASVALSQPTSFISAHNVYNCFYNHFCILHKDLFFKNYVSFVGQNYDIEKSSITLCLYLQKNQRLFGSSSG